MNKYTPVAGIPKLRQEIAELAKTYYDLDWIQLSNVVVTAGAKPALCATFLALLNPGDEVIVPTPCWVSYNHLIELAGGVVVEVPLNEQFDLDPTAIAANLTPKTKAILINSPHNPTGAIFSKKSLLKLKEVISNTEVTVISDDIYSKLVYDDDFALVPTCGFEKVVIISGYSKSQALTGWRIGYVIAEQNVAAAITSLLSHITGNAAVPSQYAALAAMAQNDQPPAETLETLRRQRQLVSDELNGTAGLKYLLPGGAFYYFLDIRNFTKNSANWCESLLLETGVVLVPGEAFQAPGYARLTFAVDDKILSKSLSLIKQFITKKEI
jgi:aspartate aminotransferase